MARNARNAIYPLREVSGFDSNAEHKISAETKPSSGSLYENTIQVIETLKVLNRLTMSTYALNTCFFDQISIWRFFTFQRWNNVIMDYCSLYAHYSNRKMEHHFHDYAHWMYWCPSWWLWCESDILAWTHEYPSWAYAMVWYGYFYILVRSIGCHRDLQSELQYWEMLFIPIFQCRHSVCNRWLIYMCPFYSRLISHTFYRGASNASHKEKWNNPALLPQHPQTFFRRFLPLGVSLTQTRPLFIIDTACITPCSPSPYS